MKNSVPIKFVRGDETHFKKLSRVPNIEEYVDLTPISNDETKPGDIVRITKVIHTSNKYDEFGNRSHFAVCNYI